MSTLYHYTCAHSRAGIGAVGVLYPSLTVDDFVWLTDLEVPIVDALGLTSHLLTCDRTAYRYRVTDDRDVIAWRIARSGVDPVRRDALETAPGVAPGNWYVSRHPVPVVLDDGGPL